MIMSVKKKIEKINSVERETPVVFGFYIPFFEGAHG